MWKTIPWDNKKAIYYKLENCIQINTYFSFLPEFVFHVIDWCQTFHPYRLSVIIFIQTQSVEVCHWKKKLIAQNFLENNSKVFRSYFEI